MRGPDEHMGARLIAMIPEKFVSEDHPLRPIRDMVDKALYELSPEFSKMYSQPADRESLRRSCSRPFFCKRSTRSRFCSDGSWTTIPKYD